jgi:hypothetical protein
MYLHSFLDAVQRISRKLKLVSTWNLGNNIFLAIPRDVYRFGADRTSPSGTSSTKVHFLFGKPKVPFTRSPGYGAIHRWKGISKIYRLVKFKKLLTFMCRDNWLQSRTCAENRSFRHIFIGLKVMPRAVWGYDLRYRWKANVKIYKLCLNRKHVGALVES